MADDINDYDSPLEYIEDKYRIDPDDEDNFVEFRPEGAEEIEFVYKMRIAAMRAEGDYVDMNYNLELLTLSRIYNDILDQRERRETYRQKMTEEHGNLPDEGHEAIDTVFRVEVADSVPLYYTLANEIIRAMAAELLSKQVFVSRNESGEFLNDLHHSALANLLYHTGVSDKRLKDEIINSNQTRNRIVHEFTARHYLKDISDVLPMVDRVNYAINELYDMLYDGRPLSD